MKTPIDYRFHADRLADSVEALIWCHNGGDDGRMLPDACHSAMDALEDYRRSTGHRRVNLKTLMKLAEEQARIEGKDPYAEMLKAIAYRSKDCYEHMEDDRDVYEDICQWLQHEATLEPEA